jgi:hypothetical protein
MLRGHLDALTRNGFAEGWAFDEAAPVGSLAVRLFGPEEELLAEGLANLHRGDLAEVGFRLGWCAFRLRLARGAETLAGARLSLRAAESGAEIAATDTWRLRDAPDGPLTTIEAVTAADPTTLRAVHQLSGCGPLLEAFIAKHGVQGFLRAAYGYVLGRPADAAGLASYERLLRLGAVTPFGLLVLLADSEEFRREPRLLAAPPEPGFVFVA